jgi:hypothetical protein
MGACRLLASPVASGMSGGPNCPSANCEWSLWHAIGGGEGGGEGGGGEGGGEGGGGEGGGEGGGGEGGGEGEGGGQLPTRHPCATGQSCTENVVQSHWGSKFRFSSYEL